MTPAYLSIAFDRRLFLKSSAVLGALACAGALAGCGDAAGPAAEGEAPAAAPAVTGPTVPELNGSAADASSPSPQGRTAVVYFSVPLTDSPSRDADSGASIVESGGDLLGNVQYAAQYVAAATGGDLLRIETEVPYATDDVIFDYALEEQHSNARPEISLVALDGSRVDDLSAYDTVLVGYPIWWYELPMPLYTFFENYDLSGKRVAPFVVHGGSGLSGTVQDIEALQPDADVEEDGLSINRRDVQANAEASVGAWVESLGLSERNPS